MTQTSDPFLSLLQEAIEAQKIGKLDQAERLYRQVLADDRNHVMAHHLLGINLNNSARPSEALAHLLLCIELSPQDPVIYNNLANTYKLLGRLQESLAACDTALALRPAYSLAYCSRANAHAELKNICLALKDFDHALSLQPNNPEAWIGRASLFIDTYQPELGLESALKALQLRPHYSDALVCAGSALIQLKRSSEAIPLLRQAIELSPHHKTAWGWLVHAKMAVCDWTDFDGHVKRMVDELVNHGARVPPLLLMNCVDIPALHATAAKLHSNTNGNQHIHFPRARSEKIRLAYISGDFRDHPIGLHSAPLFEKHDRTQFHVIGISVGPNDRSPLSARIKASFDRFYEVINDTDLEIFNLILSENIDILIDMMGLTQYARPNVLKGKPAPRIINYLAFPGTLNNNVHDYILADSIIAPNKLKNNYSEKILHLSYNYLPIDENWPKVISKGNRRSENLPKDAFVFASFNSINKITPTIYEAWMRILSAVPASVLWLQGSDSVAMSNLLKFAELHKIQPNRIIFAKRVDFEVHLQRHSLADLFLDTYPYNAHSTAAIALWAGLPVLTLQGESFASRVASSMLHSVELSELITNDLEQYKAKAVEIAENKVLLSKLRYRLINRRANFEWFNSQKFTQNFESVLISILND